MYSFRLRVLGLGISLAIVGCEPGTVTLAEPGQRSGTVARDTLFVRVTVDSVDASLRDSLGWGAGVPNAEVRLLRKGEGEWLSGFTDSIGVAAFERILPGTYLLYAQRVLDSTEVDAAGGMVRAFGDGRTVELSSSQTEELRLAADRLGSLVISEIGNGLPPPWEMGDLSALEALYFEVHNNADTVLFLDRLVFAATPNYRWTVPSTCHLTEQIRTDEAGVYVRAAVRFPGMGGDYPIGPGEVRVIAMAAIDHSQLHPALLDMSGADFEVGFQGVGNNPGVPDMVNVGLEPFYSQLLFPTRNVFVLAREVDLRDLPVMYRDTRGRGHVRIPRALLLDVVALWHVWPLRDGENPWCVPMLPRVFDRYPGGFIELGFDIDHSFGAVRSVQRRFLRRGLGGRPVLMNTNTSAADFVHDLKTPGWVPQ